MLKGSVKHRSSVLRSSGASVLLRLVLLIAAWQGPVPWCHNHTGQATAESASWLAEHLDSRHGQSPHGPLAAHGSGVLGWHFHADFPTRPAGDQDPRPGQVPAEFPASSVGGLRVTDLYSGDRLLPLSQLLVPVEHCPALASATERALACSPGSFFDGYAAALPLPLRFSVCRC